MKNLKVIISGGGTGGHIFPAIAIANAIESQVKAVEFLFVGAEDRMEMDKVPAAGYKIVGLWISGLQRKIDSRNLAFPFKLIHSIWRSKKIIKQFNPDLVIGTGGYASAPVIYVAAKRGIPSLIQEQNSYPGITNKILAKYVQKICVAYDKMERFFPSEKLILTGNPIRKDILGFDIQNKNAQNYFEINKNKQTVLVVGGSLGALTINKAIAENINRIESIGINLIWQTGASFYDKAQQYLADIDVKGVNAYAFIKEMDLAYASADIIISRAGAIAISELCCVGKPLILVPSPNVSENHQFKNAQSLVNKNAAILVEDANANRKLVDTLEDLIKNKDLKRSLSSNIKKIAVVDAAERIAKIALDLVK
ncbi:MAG: undecaprenyldiphospho-muramoylpentapeptide beta-N-acetylglucosaminyltransferase [Flavobacteriales bacterium]|nr:undecaprenyldiphospho-muramoylpentapeptide beta-N-acetylglucosaminyltransferase [Flavobacteriales bacterium]|tara:strand:+ start:29330 stop:30430 length:1101 start_codon:yes stop_codon:yes gene_type:complete